MTLDQWAKEWKIDERALQDLKGRIGIANPQILKSNKALRKEQDVLDAVRLEASEKEYRLWRNNVGATYSKTGALLRYGLANDSAKLNTRIKSADLIGVRPIKITQDLVGMTIGQFVSREVKRPGWKFKGTPHELAQLNWAELILLMGGDACFVTARGTL